MRNLFKEVSDYQECIASELAVVYKYPVYTYWHMCVRIKSRNYLVALITRQICKLDKVINIRPFVKLLLKI